MARVALKLVSLGLLISTAALADVPPRCLDFAAYPVPEVFSGPYVPPKVGKSSAGHKYRALIRSLANDPPDFAGHLQVISLACGTGCIQTAIVDKRTGDVWLDEDWDWPSNGFERVATSRLLIFNPASPPGANDELLHMPGSISYVWDEARHTLQPLPGCNGQATGPK